MNNYKKIREAFNRVPDLNNLSSNEKRVIISTSSSLFSVLDIDKLESNTTRFLEDKEELKSFLENLNDSDFYGNYKYDAPYKKRERLFYLKQDRDSGNYFVENALTIYGFFDNIKDYKKFLEKEENRHFLIVTPTKHITQYLKSGSINKKDLLSLVIKINKNNLPY